MRGPGACCLWTMNRVGSLPTSCGPGVILPHHVAAVNCSGGGRAVRLLPFTAAPMAKKSKRPPARKQQQRRPHQRPSYPQQPLAGAPAADLTIDEVVEDDYAAGALPIPDGDGPMPLPPPELAEDGESDESDSADEQPQRVAAVTSYTSTAGGPARRRVGRIDPAATAATAAASKQAQRRGSRSQNTAAMFEPLPPEDAAIPFDRVPYVPGDLRRVLIIAGLMVVLIVVANFVIGAVVK